jgi:D-alanine-D-alanine ligase
VLLLTDENRPPDKPAVRLKGRDAELSKTEYDVLAALRKLGHDVTCAGVGSDLAVIRRAIIRNKPHIVFNLVEQFDGLAFFDQHVVSYLELRKQKYTGCNPRGLMLARDKALTKKILAYHRLPVARFAVFKPRKKIVVPSRLAFPLFVKSLTDEGSEGISQASLVRDCDKLIERIAFIHEKTKSPALVEEFIEGRELYVGVFGNELLTALPPLELHHERTFHRMPRSSPPTRHKWDPELSKEVGLKSGPPARRAPGEGDRAHLKAHLSSAGPKRLCPPRLPPDGSPAALSARSQPKPPDRQNEDFADSAEQSA